MTKTNLEVTLGPVRLIPQGEGRNFDVGGERVAVFHTRSGEVFATQATCPHKGGPLADGLVGGGTVICPLHAWKFDLGTGEGAGATPAGCRLKTYPVRVTGGGLIVIKNQESRIEN